MVTIVTDTSIVGYIYCHIENYEKGLIQPSANDVYNNPEDYTISALNTSISLSQVFDTTSDELITVTDIEQCLKPFKDMLYILPGEVRSFVRISDQGGAYSDYRQIQMYDKDADGNFNKVYSLEQLNDAAVATVGSVLTTKDLDSYYTFAKTHTHLTTYTDDLSSIRVELFACVLEPQEDKT